MKKSVESEEYREQYRYIGKSSYIRLFVYDNKERGGSKSYLLGIRSQ